MAESEPAGVARAGESQGLVTRDAALKFLSEDQLQRRLGSGALVCVFPSVYRVVGAPETWRQSLEALLLWAGHGAVLSHRTAAALHGFEQFEEGPLDLTVIRKMRVPESVSVFRVDALLRSEIDCVDDLDVTSVTRTLIDLASRSDSQTLHAVFSQALREKKTTLEKLERAAARSGNRPGVIDVRALLHEFQGGGWPDRE